MNVTTITGDAYAVVRTEGRLTATSVPAVRAAISELIDSGHAFIVVDLSATPFVDSSGLGVLIGGLKSARQASGDLRIAGASEGVRSVLALTNLDRILRSYPTVQEAFDGR
ncbi:STAS domain-containing protein [Microbacterium aquimaris]|uniref:STAS domain-containing protein n=1 Tax=Microbacterium aquimaris TaxID=459816 RepID=UPI002AD575F4|nr:STAS domain-containing protein [Microbacterium aquimaris]MDZ8275172.1 STAS domain-containing protein [Microbacterium aquimaris]